MSKRLTGEDPIDFGIHKGTALKDVSPYYLLWCYRKDRASPSVRQYIRVNFDNIVKQAKNEKDE